MVKMEAIMLSKKMYAEDINFKMARLGRIIETDYLIDFTVDEIIHITREESWLMPGGMFTPENAKKYSYSFTCVNELEGHKVDYANEDEAFILGCEDCEDEMEVLIPAGAMYKVLNSSCHENQEDMGFDEIELEFLGFKKEK
ncbi:hypothetical protein ART14_14790 [Listeria monocytogenes]|nr:hypothetical protein [Listeria monocytogenes]